MGYFNVQEGQICFDHNGEVRVWINNDLSKNYAENGQLLYNENAMTEDDMVQEILQLVFENVDKESEP